MIPLSSVSAEQITKSYSQKHTLINGERNFNGNGEDILDVSEKVDGLKSASVEFTTEFKTSSNGYQSLFYVGAETNDFGYAANNFITLYMNAGKEIGVEMKGINGGYVHFYLDVPRFNDNEWHELSLKIVDGTSTRFFLDGVEYTPEFSDNSQGMPNESSTKFVLDTNFEADVLHIGGAKRADRYDWLFEGSMKNTSFTTDAYEEGTPAPALHYENMDFTGEAKGEDISEDLDYITSLEEGTLSFRLRREEPGNQELQHLLTVGNSNSKTDYSSIYIKGNKIGYEFNNGDLTIANGEQEVESFKNNIKWYTITMVFDGSNATVYVDDQKAFTLPSSVFLNATEEADNVVIGMNKSNENESQFTGYMDSFKLYNSVLSEKYITQTLNSSTRSQRVEKETIERPLPPKEEAYRSDDFKMFASVSSDMLFNDSLVGDPEIMGEGGFGFRIPALLRAVTPDTEDQDVTIAFADKGNDSADWGNVGVASRRSFDNGKTWSNVDDILRLPPRDAPQEFHDWGSAFYIDPLPVQTDNGEIIMMVDMWPESKGLHASSWLENGTGYKTIDGKDYLVLYDGDSKVGDGHMTDLGNEYTVREDGWIYDSNNQKTNYYIPQHHSDEYQYETMGDMYYMVGDPDYITEMPPYLSENPEGKQEGSNDIYVGNIYLSYDKPEFDPENPVFVEKREVGPDKKGELYSKYADYETDPAPLRATVTSYLWVTKSKDYGKTWSQPIDITPQVKIPADGAFLGVGPGTGIMLEHQKDPSKNGRVLMPVYALGKGTALYSDDDGVTWERGTSSSSGYINNIDEMQFIEQYDGTIMSFGRQRGKGKTPVSISKDGGETWSEQTNTDLTSVAVQKSVITYPIDSKSDKASDERFEYVEGMQKGKQYVIASHATGNPNDASRSNGAISLGEVQEDDTILWIAQRTLKLKPNPYADTDGRENFFGYSSLAVLENGNIGVLFEPQPNNYIAYAEVNLEWILNGEQEGIIFEPTITEESIVDVEEPELIDLSLKIEKDSNTSSGMAVGDTLKFTSVFNENIFVSGQPVLTFNINGKELKAVYTSGSATNKISFSYQIKEGDIVGDAPIISVSPSINVPEGTLVEGVKNDSILYNSTSEIQLYPDNKSTLVKRIEEADQIKDRSGYTEASWDVFVQRRADAKLVSDDHTSSVFAIQNALANLAEALDNLEALTDSSAKRMQALVEKYREEGEFMNDRVARSLSIHLIAVGQYENQKKAEKVVKHMEGFKLLLDKQKENEQISESAYNKLKADADALVEKWK